MKRRRSWSTKPDDLLTALIKSASLRQAVNAYVHCTWKMKGWSVHVLCGVLLHASNSICRSIQTPDPRSSSKVWHFCGFFASGEYSCKIRRAMLGRATAAVFTARQHIACYAERCISYDRFCPSVRPSVTVRYHVKTTPATIMRSSLDSSFLMVNFSEKFLYTEKIRFETAEPYLFSDVAQTATKRSESMTSHAVG